MFDADRFSSDDRDYVRGVIREHSPLVLMVCQSYTRDYDHAQDLVQETWKSVCLKAHTFRGTGSFKAWLHRVATNTCLTDLRARKVAAESLDRYAGEPMNANGWRQVDPLYDTERRELHRAIHRALAQLTEGERDAVTLRWLEGQSPREVGEKMGITPATVRSHVRHALNHLRRIMEEPDSDLSRYRSTS